ncbi:hypothetical protein BP00DRAFT_249363 [Aspergillus indologenus CBS 114.80]|uniref:Uncharacterized protein n=1 Tax=Aspergillus indologenus CBS 114.80 TaxID=1450541 RepID=A0A2V5HYR2_9EURO|nr:hypothetical protein BP00DRAFT_249363 [Aspergillus indologenus CBS 114.80]
MSMLDERAVGNSTPPIWRTGTIVSGPRSRFKGIWRADIKQNNQELTPSTVIRCLENDLTIQILIGNSAPGSEVQSSSVNGSAPLPRGTQTRLSPASGSPEENAPWHPLNPMNWHF